MNEEPEKDERTSIFRLFCLVYTERVRLLLALRVARVMADAALAQSPVPRLEDYPVAEIFNGKPVAPVLTTSQQRMYRTPIREGVTRDGASGLAVGKTQRKGRGRTLPVTIL
jgi:hypothetical protein